MNFVRFSIQDVGRVVKVQKGLTITTPSISQKYLPWNINWTSSVYNNNKSLRIVEEIDNTKLVKNI